LAGLLSCREEIGVARSNYLFTSESVSEGHPDKVSDRISDEVVDLYYRATIEQGLDVWALRCAAETLVTTNRVARATGHHVRLCHERDAGTDAGADPVFAHAILRRLAEARKSGAEPTLGPDAKSQLSPAL
jgi:S-adenosylmethionine synthetase